MAKFTAGKTIVDLAAATPDLPTLVIALKAGKLVDTLSGAGPFTVFAPTNEAFARIPKATLDHLLDPKNIRELGDVITYHAASDSAVLFVVVVCLEGHACTHTAYSPTEPAQSATWPWLLYIPLPLSGGCCTMLAALHYCSGLHMLYVYC